MFALAAGQHLGAFLPADVEIAQDLLQLLGLDACAPIIVAGSSGSPWTIASTRVSARSMNRS